MEFLHGIYLLSHDHLRARFSLMRIGTQSLGKINRYIDTPVNLVKMLYVSTSSGYGVFHQTASVCIPENLKYTIASYRNSV